MSDFIISQELFDLYYDAVDAMVDNNFGVNCDLVFPSVKSVCPNCIFDSINNTSSNKYKAGGPISFTNGVCPYCDGVGYTDTIVTETIKLRCYYERRNWIKVPSEVNIRDGAVLTYGHIVDLPKCKRCDYAIINKDVSQYGSFRYRLAGEPILHGFRKNKYFIAFWNKYQ